MQRLFGRSVVLLRPRLSGLVHSHYMTDKPIFQEVQQGGKHVRISFNAAKASRRSRGPALEFRRVGGV